MEGKEGEILKGGRERRMGMKKRGIRRLVKGSGGVERVGVIWEGGRE